MGGALGACLFGDAGCPEEGPPGLWVPIHPGLLSLSSTVWGATPKYELRFRHPNLPMWDTHTILPGHYQEVIVCYACMQNLPEHVGG